jgi:AcrR family transcriptional regulator
VEVALDVFGRLGYRGGSLREIAEHVGLSDAGVLHHFGSKEQLLIAVLEQREVLSQGDRPPDLGIAVLDGLRALVAHNATQPGIVQLFVTLSAEATDPEHPAHEFFTVRYRDVTRYFVEQLTVARDAGQIRADADVDGAARQLIAMMDGLQVQWLLDPALDMTEVFDQFLVGFERELGRR